LTCTPDSLAPLYERVAFWQATEAIKALATRRQHGRVTDITLYRYVNEVFLRGGPGALAVHWLESTSVHATTGAQLAHHSVITHHRLSAAHVSQGAQAGRGRWKVDNENNNVLKTKGDHLAHNFGHGKQSLAAFLLSRNVLAFLFHTVLEWSDDKYALLRQVLARRQTFFSDVQAFMRYMVFDSWEHMMAFMIRGLELESQCDTS
jgi:hypothetical protein